MKLENGMYLYHGSYMPIESIDLLMCACGKDFGKGFYLTEDSEQAKSFIKNSLKKAKNVKKIPQNQNFGFVTTFRYVETEVAIKKYTFDELNRDWLWFVSMNRRTEIANELKNLINPNILSAEIIVGKIANDSTNPTIMAYLNGVFGNIKSEKAINFAIGQLMPNRLNNQYCFLTKNAISCLEYVEVNKYE